MYWRNPVGTGRVVIPTTRRYWLIALELAEQINPKDPLVRVWLPVKHPKTGRIYYRKEWVRQSEQIRRNLRLATDAPPGATLDTPDARPMQMLQAATTDDEEQGKAGSVSQIDAGVYGIDLAGTMMEPWSDPEIRWELLIDGDDAHEIEKIEDLLVTLTGGSTLAGTDERIPLRAPYTLTEAIQAGMEANPMTPVPFLGFLQTAYFSPVNQVGQNVILISPSGLGKTTAFLEYRDYLHSLYAREGDQSALLNQPFSDVVIVTAPRTREDVTGLQYIVDADGRPITLSAAPDDLRAAIERQDLLGKPVLLVIDEAQGLAQEAQDQLRTALASGVLSIATEQGIKNLRIVAAATANFDDRQTHASSGPFYGRFLPLVIREGASVMGSVHSLRTLRGHGSGPPDILDWYREAVQEMYQGAGDAPTTRGYYTSTFERLFAPNGIAHGAVEGTTIAAVRFIQDASGVSPTSPDFPWDHVQRLIESGLSKKISANNLSIADESIHAYAQAQTEAAKNYIHNMRILMGELATATRGQLTEDPQGDIIIDYSSVDFQTDAIHKVIQAYWETRIDSPFTAISTMDVSNEEASIGTVRQLAAAFAYAAQAMATHPDEAFEAQGIVRKILEDVLLHPGSLKAAQERAGLHPSEIDAYKDAMEQFLGGLRDRVKSRPIEAQAGDEADVGYLLSVYHSLPPVYHRMAFTRYAVDRFSMIAPDHDYRTMPFAVSTAYYAGKRTSNDAYEFNHALGVELCALQHEIDVSIARAVEQGERVDVNAIVTQAYQNALREGGRYPHLREYYEGVRSSAESESLEGFAMRNYEMMQSLTIHALGHASFRQTSSSSNTPGHIERVLRDAVNTYENAIRQYDSLADKKDATPEEWDALYDTAVRSVSTAATAHRYAHSIKLTNDASNVSHPYAAHAAAWLGLLDGIGTGIMKIRRDPTSGVMRTVLTQSGPNPEVVQIQVPPLPHSSDSTRGLSHYQTVYNATLEKAMHEWTQAFSPSPDPDLDAQIFVNNKYFIDSSMPPIQQEVLALLEQAHGHLNGARHLRTT